MKITKFSAERVWYMDFETKKLESLINEIKACCEERAQAEAKRFGLPYGEIEVLKLLGQDRYATVTGLSSKLGVAKSRVTKLLSDLLEKGLAVQANDPQDGRVKLFALSNAGKELLRQIVSYENDIFLKLASCMAEQERHMVLKSLDILRMAMEKIKKDI